jgi:hypothetical protein
MRVPRGRSLSEPSRHTCLMTLDESPLMPILERLRWRQGWRAARQSTCAREASGQMVSKTRVHRKAFSESGDRARASRSGSALCASDGLDQPRPPPLWIRDQHNAQENSSVVTTEWMSSPLSEEELIELPECVVSARYGARIAARLVIFPHSLDTARPCRASGNPAPLFSL